MYLLKDQYLKRITSHCSFENQKCIRRTFKKNRTLKCNSAKFKIPETIVVKYRKKMKIKLIERYIKS